MCVECSHGFIDRRSFLQALGGVTVGLSVPPHVLAAQLQSREWTALDDPSVVHHATTFRSGDRDIEGYLARPRESGRARPVILLHGNPGATDDVRMATAQLAQAGFVGLLVDWGSRDPLPEGEAAQRQWRDRITGYAFWKLVLDDIQAAIGHLKAQSFVRSHGGVGLIGFCGGGKQALLFATRPSDVTAIVAFYASARYRQFRNDADPVPELVDVANDIRGAVQGHYGMLDQVALPQDAKDFEALLRSRGVRAPLEMHYYEQAGHSFYNYTRPPGSDPGFDFRPVEAELARRRMIDFLRRHVT
jgi:carboxymethylenebutenolidase